MNALREKLRSQAPELYAALERSWEVAFDEWLPAVQPKSDSFNSYPHIRNLENYLHRLVVAYERRTSSSPLFSQLELYVLLVCILLHDIGKAGDSPKSKDKANRHEEHDKRSEGIIRENWAHLGIPSLGLAHSVAKICGVHSAKPESLKNELAVLSTIVVDPFGQIRERELAAVLILVDHMDTTALRTVADYLKESDFAGAQIKTLGAFRKKIRGVDIDLECGLVKVVLDENWRPFSEDETVSIEAIQEANRDIPPDQPEKQPPLSKQFLDQLQREFAKPHSALSTILFESPAQYETSDPLHEGKVPKVPLTIEACEHRWLIFEDPGVRIQPLRKAPIGKESVKFVQDRVLLAILMRDTHTNHRVLESISDILTTIGLPLLGWRIEYQEHLFEWNGRESHEPVLSVNRMKDALEKGWALSTQIFAAGKLGYSTLAAELGEPCPGRVKMALNRLNVIASAISKTSRPFWLSDTEWHWVTPRSFDHMAADNSTPSHCGPITPCKQAGCNHTRCSHWAAVNTYKALLDLVQTMSGTTSGGSDA